MRKLLQSCSTRSGPEALTCVDAVELVLVGQPLVHKDGGAARVGLLARACLLEALVHTLRLALPHVLERLGQACGVHVVAAVHHRGDLGQQHGGTGGSLGGKRVCMIVLQHGTGLSAPVPTQWLLLVGTQ